MARTRPTCKYCYAARGSIFILCRIFPMVNIRDAEGIGISLVGLNKIKNLLQIESGKWEMEIVGLAATNAPATAQPHLATPTELAASKNQCRRSNRVGRCSIGCGSRSGGRQSFNLDDDKGRNVMERAIHRLKDFRAIATRQDKRGHLFLALGTVARVAWLPRPRSDRPWLAHRGAPRLGHARP